MPVLVRYMGNQSDLLQYALEHDMIDLSYVQDQCEIMKRKELLEKHPYTIWEGKDGKWYTYLPDEDKGRKLIKRSTRESVENQVLSTLQIKLENPTIEEVFNEWNDRRLELKKISPGSHLRLKQIFDRHYGEMKKRRIKNVDPEEYVDFLERQIPEFDLTAKSFAGLKMVTRGFLRRAKKRRLINFNIEEMFQDVDTSESDFYKTFREDRNEVFNEEELPKMLNYLEENLDVKNLGILLMFLTGIRVGELVALKHSDFNSTFFTIQRTETRIPDGEHGYTYEIKNAPKTTAGQRTVIIPEGYAWVAQKIKACNPFEEYIFVENGKRCTTNCIRSRMKRVCKHLGIVPKSPHKARKTYGSILLDNGIDNRLITDVMGHTNITCTEGHYHWNRKSIERKSGILSSIPDFQGNQKIAQR